MTSADPTDAPGPATPAGWRIESFFDPATSTFSHLLLNEASGDCALVDSVLDYDPQAGRTATTSAQRLIDRVQALGARVQWLLETHVHADHLSAAQPLKAALGGQLVMGQGITTVQQVFGTLFNAGPDFARDGRQFDRLVADGEVLPLGPPAGGLSLQAMHTPGHTPACVSWLLLQQGQPAAAFVGDTLFAPDYGTARCDFPGGDAATLYRSIQRLLALPPELPLYLCHDYPPPARAAQAPQPCSTVAAQRQANVHVHTGVAEAEFVAMRQARDAQLAPPALLLPAVQVNMRAGHLPPPEANGRRYLKIPLNAL